MVVHLIYLSLGSWYFGCYDSLLVAYLIFFALLFAYIIIHMRSLIIFWLCMICWWMFCYLIKGIMHILRGFCQNFLSSFYFFISKPKGKKILSIILFVNFIKVLYILKLNYIFMCYFVNHRKLEIVVVNDFQNYIYQFVKQSNKNLMISLNMWNAYMKHQ
jgi:hypothetical protein